MKRLYILILYIVILSGTVQAQELANEDNQYRLSTGDIIQVTVYGEPDLSMQLTVIDDVKVNYAYVGEFVFNGMSTAEVEQLITQRLKGDYLINPQVSVVISEYRPFFIQGEIRIPGSYPYQPELTVRQAISLAGGLKERASSRKWYVVSENGNETEKRKVDEDELVKPGDTIIIEQSFF